MEFRLELRTFETFKLKVQVPAGELDTGSDRSWAANQASSRHHGGKFKQAVRNLFLYRFCQLLVSDTFRPVPLSSVLPFSWTFLMCLCSLCVSYALDFNFFCDGLLLNLLCDTIMFSSRVWNFKLALFGLLPRYLFVSLRFSDLRPYFRIIVSSLSFSILISFSFFSYFSQYFYSLSSFLVFAFGVDMKKWKCQCSIQHYKSKTTRKRISQTKQQTRIYRSVSPSLAPDSPASTRAIYWKTKVTKWVEMEQFQTDRFPTADWIPTGYCYSVAQQTCVKSIRKQYVNH